MHTDANGRNILEGGMVTILDPDPRWFAHLPGDARAILQAACHRPLRVACLDDDGSVSLDLPSTRDPDGDHVTNRISLRAGEVLLVQRAR